MYGVESFEGSNNNKCRMYYNKLSVMIINVHLHVAIIIYAYFVNYLDHFFLIHFVRKIAYLTVIRVIIICIIIVIVGNRNVYCII